MPSQAAGWVIALPEILAGQKAAQDSLYKQTQTESKLEREFREVEMRAYSREGAGK